jgi:beta-N-acetylhexosaminidase
VTPSYSAPAVDEPELAAVVASMSIEAKAGQMLMIGFTGTTSASAVPLIRELKPGGVIMFARNLESESQIRQLTSGIQSEANRWYGNSLLIAIDQEGGRVSRLRPPMCPILRANADLAKNGSAAAVKAQAEVTALALKHLGINMNLAPVLDVFSNPDNKVIGDRSYGPDQAAVAQLGEEYVRSLQSQGVLATLKHFPGHGPTAVDSHTDLPIVNLAAEDLDGIHIWPFAQVIAKAQPAAVMTAHIIYTKLDSKPATMSRVIINDILRTRLGFTGLVITDSLEMDALRKNYTVRQVVSSSVNAGADLLLVSHDPRLAREVRANIIELVRDGEIPESTLNSAVERILRTKARFGVLNTNLRAH